MKILQLIICICLFSRIFALPNQNGGSSQGLNGLNDLVGNEMVHIHASGDYQGRRALMDSMPIQCYNVEDSVCDGITANGVPMFEDFDPESARNLVAYYCCSLREDSVTHLYQAAHEFQSICLGEKFLKWQSKLSSTVGLDFSQQAIAHYCPNYISPEYFYTSSWTDLWKIASFQLPKSAILQCDAQPTGTGSVDVVLHGFSEDLFPHVYLKVEGEIMGWGPEHPAQDTADFNSVTGLPGLFYSSSEGNYQLPPDALVWTIENVDIGHLREKRAEFETQGTYDLISHNCAHVALQLLAEGLGCKARIIPFFSPVAMINVLKGICAAKYW